ncbi:hypothetical protein A2276_03065 [candidate division WOR-1 bacterium RIFOXYA12_FULL_43_27]|uniref:Uncharacterized protein n=1 Tax=candidate division WOR-1 bacterium RIFOXYC2_FULL_46_14 TaxID=1802587 RepID=A0A1F4U7Q1_UNCSA|nr:MAG: hypothetical protein A2276_03065 [candidate division WOR-1 bacterium RIFOXYA12_FULL_43_27]OGC19317.1 MAG: hypothetical protein A2292_01270 [candidate division WOR-1 bacterium RIFOXYB2_FULL_46_45]OGC30306.1 MAG: hypothetical protein A2232_01270 [candidate division WOR-1 bacterium RIFOXYA2_FULL_46_56]OGC40907.1 MAG: hypothetical protein A2438_01270 [candidate division WOR-1 bacterium RIFOXYC2_FULL_46_14]
MRIMSPYPLSKSLPPAYTYHPYRGKRILPPHEVMDDPVALRVSCAPLTVVPAYQLLYSFELNQLASFLTISMSVDDASGFVLPEFESRDKNETIQNFPLAKVLDAAMLDLEERGFWREAGYEKAFDTASQLLFHAKKVIDFCAPPAMASLRIKTREYLARLFMNFPEFTDILRSEGISRLIYCFYEAEFGRGQREYIELILRGKIGPVETTEGGGLVIRFKADGFDCSGINDLVPVEGVVERLHLEGCRHKPDGGGDAHSFGDDLLFTSLAFQFPNLSMLDVRGTFLDDPKELSEFVRARSEHFPDKRINASGARIAGDNALCIISGQSKTANAPD